MALEQLALRVPDAFQGGVGYPSVPTCVCSSPPPHFRRRRTALVATSIQRLQRDGLVTCKPYRSIFLTQKGQELAATSRERHHVVREFLMALVIDADTADADAEGIEHHVSEATLHAFRSYLRRSAR